MKINCKDCSRMVDGYCGIDNHPTTRTDECIFGPKRQKAFMKELKSLLAKYEAGISTDDHWTGYPECGMDVRMTIEFEWNSNGYEGFTDDIDLGGFIDGK